MKTMKVALLATAALAAVSVSARADDAASIKAQLEALNARIAQLEAAPAVPTGYSLLTMTEVAPLSLTGEKAADVSNTKSHRISVLPTADMPAATTIDWDLEVRARISAHMWDNGIRNTASSDDDQVVVEARGRIRVKASTDTSVGTVGVDMRIQGASEFGDAAAVGMNIAWGWWQMTPEWTLGGGYTGTLSDPGHGQDGWISHGATMWLASGAPADQEQIRLTYASGPLTWAIAIEDNDNVGFGGVANHRTELAVASRIDYAGDAFSASLSGYYGARNAKDVWQIGAGADFTLGDMATLSVNGAIGHDNGNFDYVAITGFAGFDLTEATSFEISAAHSWNDNGVADRTVINGGIYWKPVDQLKIGLQADHTIDHGSPANVTTVSFVTWFSY